MILRYDMECIGDASWMKSAEDGEYVEYIDYKALRAENEKLKECLKFQIGLPCQITYQECRDINEALSEQQ